MQKAGQHFLKHLRDLGNQVPFSKETRVLGSLNLAERQWNLECCMPHLLLKNRTQVPRSLHAKKFCCIALKMLIVLTWS